MKRSKESGFAPKKLVRSGLGFLLGLTACAAMAQESGLNQSSYAGSLGLAHIGMTLLVKGGNVISGGHYYYAKYLIDIPLTGAMQGSALTLQGQDGGSFALKFVGNGSDGGNPLDFNNSVGLEGTWSKDGKTLPVKLTGVGLTPVPKRWYENVTNDSDVSFEAMVQGFYKAATAGDRAGAAKYVAFPLRVNQSGKSRYIRSAAELSAQWDKIFTPAYLAALKKDIPHELPVIKGLAMLGAGDVFFSDKGATALNLP